MLGTNDSKEHHWNVQDRETFLKDQDRYFNDYVEMAQSLQNLSTQPKLYIMIPPPLYEEGIFAMQGKITNELLPLEVRRIGEHLGLPSSQVINLFEPLGGSRLDKSDMFADGCHPNDAGYHLIAQIVYNALGLQKDEL